MKDEDHQAEMLEMLRAKNEADSEIRLSDGDLIRIVQSAFKTWDPMETGVTVTMGGKAELPPQLRSRDVQDVAPCGGSKSADPPVVQTSPHAPRWLKN